MTRALATRLGFAALLCAARARAHEAPETSATITLRDRAVEVWIDVETLPWLQRVTHGGARDALDDAAALTPAVLEEIVRDADRCASDASLDVGGRRVTLLLAHGAGVDEVLASIGGRPQGQHHRTRVALRGALVEAPGPRVDAALRLPVAFGPAIVNLVRPESRWVSAGATARLTLDAPQTPAPPASRRAWVTPAAFLVVAASLAVYRRTRDPQPPAR